MPTLEFFHARAEECAREAEATSLANVRDRLIRAQSAWLVMAARMERTAEERAVQAAEKAKVSVEP